MGQGDQGDRLHGRLTRKRYALRIVYWQRLSLNFRERDVREQAVFGEARVGRGLYL